MIETILLILVGTLFLSLATVFLMPVGFEIFTAIFALILVAMFQELFIALGALVVLNFTVRKLC